ncbi:MAG: hypothetical protein ACI9LA_002330, partial [Bacteroidia bacterium]
MRFSPTIKNVYQLATAMLLVVLFISPSMISAQTIDVGPPDTSVCNGTPIDLTAITSGTGGTGSAAVL